MSDPVIADPIENGKKTVSAREISKWSMTIAALWIASLSILRALWGLLSESTFGLDMGDIILSGLSIAAAFSPVYFSIILDKVKEIKLGGRN